MTLEQMVAYIAGLRRGPRGVKVGPSERLTLILIAAHNSDRLPWAEVGIDELAAETGMTSRSQRRIIWHLESKGLLVGRRRGAPLPGHFGPTFKKNLYLFSDVITDAVQPRTDDMATADSATRAS